MNHEVYTSDIDPVDQRVKSSDKFFAVGFGAAAVLSLIATLSRDIDSAIRHDENYSVTVADQPNPFRELLDATTDTLSSMSEEERVYHAVNAAFDDIIAKTSFLPHQEKKITTGFGENKTMTIPSITVGGKVYKLEVESCVDHSLSPQCGRANSPANRITLSNSQMRGVYRIDQSGMIELKIYDLQNPQIDGNKQVVPNSTAYIFNTQRFADVDDPSYDPFGVPRHIYEGNEYKFLEEKIKALQNALRLLYDAKVAKDAAGRAAAKKRF